MSATELIFGSRQLAEITSSTVTLWKSVNVNGAAENVGGKPPAVAARTASVCQ